MFNVVIADPNPALFRDIGSSDLILFNGTFEEVDEHMPMISSACIANAGNSRGIMGAGVAGAIRNRFGVGVGKRVLRAISKGELQQKVGESTIVPLSPLIARDSQFRFCAYTITMMNPGETLDPNARIAYTCMLNTLRAVQRYNELNDDEIKTLVTAGFGTGIGGLDPASVGLEMLEAYAVFLAHTSGLTVRV